MQSYTSNADNNKAALVIYCAILLVAWHTGAPAAWTVCLALISIIGFFLWASNLKRNRAIADTPTSSIASAAQGYVELYGRAVNSREYYAEGGRSGLPCIWYRYIVYERQKNGDGKDTWVEIDRRVSESTFAIDDGSGRCQIDPDHAEVITTHKSTREEGHYKTIEEELRPSDRIYVLGDFSTIGGAATQLDANEDIAGLLAEWKKDRLQLGKRFDLNQDGKIDMMEWGLARRAAQREVEKQHRELRQQPGVHVVRAPQDGRLFLLSNLSPDQLKNRYVLWGWFHLLTFFVAAAISASVGAHMALW